MSINYDIFTNNNANVVIDMKKNVDLSIYSVTFSYYCSGDSMSIHEYSKGNEITFTFNR